MEQLTQQSDDALAHHAQMEADKSAAWNDLNSMSNDDRVAQMRDENSTVDYGSAGYRAATAEYMQQNGLDDGMVERGGEIVAQQVTEDGRLVGCMAVRDADGNVLEEKFYALSTKAPEPDATASDTGSAPQQGQYAQSVGAEPAAEMADTGTAGTAEAPAMEPDTRYTEPGHANTDIHIDGETVRATTTTLDEVLTAKYQMFDEGHGVVETSDLGKLQVSRVSVDEATGDTRWQVIRKGNENEFGGPESEDAIATFERKGNRGSAQTFKDVIRDIRNTRTFDQISLIDSQNRDRPDDSHLFR